MKPRRVKSWGVLFGALAWAGCASNVAPPEAEDREPTGPRDLSPPELEILEPSPGAFLPPELVLVRVRVADEGPITLDIGGDVLTTATSGEIRHELAIAPGAHWLEVTATDAAGNSTTASTSFVSGIYAREASPVRDALAVSVGPDAFDALSRALERTIADALFDAPLASEGEETRVTGIAYSALDATLVPSDGGVGVRVELSGLRVFFETTALGTSEGELSASRLSVAGRVDARIADGAIVAEHRDPEVTLEGGSFSIDGILGFLDDFAFVRDYVEATVVGALEDGMADALADLAASLTGLAIPAFSDDVSAELGSLTLGPEGLVVGIDLTLAPAAAALYPDAPGPLTLTRASVPPVDGVGVAVAIDALEAVLYRGWQAGDYGTTREGFDTGLLLALAPELGDRLAPRETVTLVVESVLPPTFGIAADGSVDMTLADLEMRAVRSDGTTVPLVALGIAFDVMLDADDAQISFALGDPSLLGARAGEGVSRDTAQALADLVAPSLADAVVSMAFDLPALDVLPYTVVRVGADDGWLHVAGDVR
jgi:hypothetical protein